MSCNIMLFHLTYKTLRNGENINKYFVSEKIVPMARIGRLIAINRLFPPQQNLQYI